MYTPFQTRLIRALAATGSTPWHLAGQWFFGETHRGLKRLKAPAIDPPRRALVEAAWRLSRATPASFAGGAPCWSEWPQKLVVHHLQNSMAWLTAGLLWETLFPETFTWTRIAEHAAGLEHVGPDDLAAWVNANLDPATSPLYADLVSVGVADCVRMVRDGVPQHFREPPPRKAPGWIGAGAMPINRASITTRAVPMPKFILVLLAALLDGAPFARADVSPLRFAQFGIGSDLDVHFSHTPIMTDETWYVAGSCEGATTYTDIGVVDFSIGDDIAMFLAENRLMADRVVCIVNPDEAPDEFWKANK